jgi:hypothetical protein
MTRRNQMLAISPYWDGEIATWVFDDQAVELRREPFVAGIPAMIDELLPRQLPDRNDQRSLRQPFRLLFSRQPFPSALTLDLVREELGGASYRFEEQEGWLCPALFRYFDTPPQHLYVQAEELARDSTSITTLCTTCAAVPETGTRSEGRRADRDRLLPPSRS